MRPASAIAACCAKARRPTSWFTTSNGLGVEPDWVGEIVHDLPGGEWRRVQRAKGYRSIIVNGVETFDEGKCTGATPGKLLRHGHA